MAFIRFVIEGDHKDSHLPQGVFTAAYDLHDSGRLSSPEKSEIKQLLTWFARNLPSPEDEPPDRTIFWYKSQSAEIIKKTWELATILKRHGWDVSIITTEKPGYVYYEDPYQVGAVPFEDTLRK